MHVAPLGDRRAARAEPDAVLDARIAAVGVEPPYVLSVGTIEPRKGLDTLAAAVARRAPRRTPTLTLVLAGPTGMARRARARRRRASAGSARSTRRRSTRSTGGATLCALPSRYEGFGLPALEAMARGCPVDRVRRDRLPEVVGDAGRARAARRRRRRGPRRSRTCSTTTAARAELAAPGPAPGRRRSPGPRPPQAHLRRVRGRGGSRGALVDSARVRLLLDVSAVPARPVGAGVYTVQLARGLAGHDELDLHLLARRDDAARWADLAPEGGDPPRGPRAPAGPARLGADAGARRSRAGSAIDVWHGPHYTMPLRLDVPAVVTVHDLTFFDHPEWHERSKVAFFPPMLRVERDARRGADRGQRAHRGPAPRAARTRRRRSSSRRTASITSASARRPRRRRRPRAARARLGIRPPYLAFAGTLEPRKDVPTLIDAFARIAPDRPDLRLVIAGRDGWGADRGARRGRGERRHHPDPAARLVARRRRSRRSSARPKPWSRTRRSRRGSGSPRSRRSPAVRRS